MCILVFFVRCFYLLCSNVWFGLQWNSLVWCGKLRNQQASKRLECSLLVAQLKLMLQFRLQTDCSALQSKASQGKARFTFVLAFSWDSLHLRKAEKRTLCCRRRCGWFWFCFWCWPHLGLLLVGCSSKRKQLHATKSCLPLAQWDNLQMPPLLLLMSGAWGVESCAILRQVLVLSQLCTVWFFWHTFYCLRLLISCVINNNCLHPHSKLLLVAISYKL